MTTTTSNEQTAHTKQPAEGTQGEMSMATTELNTENATLLGAGHWPLSVDEGNTMILYRVGKNSYCVLHMERRKGHPPVTETFKVPPTTARHLYWTVLNEHIAPFR